MKGLRAWLDRLLSSRRRERELADELESHFQLHIDDNIRTGMTPEEARRQAIIAFGPVESIKDDYRERAGLPFVESIVQDVRYGARSLRRHTGFAVLAVATLALGVGATTAMWSLVDTLMLRPLPHVRQPERLAYIEEIANYHRYREVGARMKALELTGFNNATVSLGVGPQAMPIQMVCTTPNYFSLLGAVPMLGRGFVAGEDRPGGEQVVVISHGLWRRQFGAASDVVGRRVDIAGVSHTVVGVAPPAFRGIARARVDAWVLIATHPGACYTGDINQGSGFWLSVVARVRDGYSWEQAAADAVAADSTPYMFQERRPDGSIESRRQTPPPVLTPIRTSELTTRTADNRLALWLAGGAIVLLLISCANVAGLLMMRAVERRREIAIRRQLGATRLRVFQQLLSENLALAGLCAVAAVAVAVVVDQMLRAFYPLPDGSDLFSGRTVWVLVGFALAAGVISGVLPAFQAGRTEVAGQLRTGRSVHERARGRQVLLVAQVALALTLIVSAGLFSRSVANYKHELGFDLDRVFAASVDFETIGMNAADARARYDAMLDRVRQVPGVESAALSTNQVAGARGGMVTSISRFVGAPDGCCHASVKVSPDYFRTLGIQIARGRALTEADARPGAAPVVIIEDQLAASIFGSDDPIGKCAFIQFGNHCVEVVGISESARRGSLRSRQFDSQFFLPLQSGREHMPHTLLVRAGSSGGTTSAHIAAAIRSAASDLPFVDIQALGDLVNVEARSWRLGATIFGMFATLAVVLATIGIYGALAFSIRQRTPEIGVRVAFGASPSDIGRLIMRHALLVVAAGWVMGTIATMWLTKSLESLLLGVAPTDPATLVGASVTVLVAGILGGIIPALRAARIDPAAALRAE